MDNSNSDDGIEVIEDTLRLGGVTNSPKASSPKPGPDSFSSINPASLHALQTAFTSLQRSHNELKKKNEELLQKKNSLQRKILDMDFSKMEFNLHDDDIPSVAHAAGAMGGDGASASEQAELGHKKYLLRRVYQAEVLLSKSQDEIRSLKSKNQNQVKQVEEMQTARKLMEQDLQSLTECLEEKRKELDDSQIHIQDMSKLIGSLRTEMQKQTANFQTKEQTVVQRTLQENEKYLERTHLKSGEPPIEVRNLESRLQEADQIIMRLTMNLQEKDNRLKDSERKIAQLEQKCQHLERQTSMKHQSPTFVGANFTDLCLEEFGEDTEVTQLKKVLLIAERTRKTVADMTVEADAQSKMLAKLKGGELRVALPEGKPVSLRPEVLGASMQLPYREAPEYKDVNPSKISGGASMDSPPEDKLQKMVINPGTDNSKFESSCNRSGKDPYFLYRDQEILKQKQTDMSSPVFQSTVRNPGMNEYNVADSIVTRKRPEPFPNFETSLSKSNSVRPWTPNMEPAPGSGQDSNRSRSEVLRSSTSPRASAVTRSASETSFRSNIGSLGDSAGRGQMGASSRLLNYPVQDEIYENLMDPDYENIYKVTRDTQIEGSDRQSHPEQQQQYTDPQVGIRPMMPVTNSEPEAHGVSAVKICPVCSQEFSRLTMSQFQTHVFECFDNCEEGTRTNSSEQKPMTLSPENNQERTCPMCGQLFSAGVPQEAYEGHVLAHFGEEPAERFEVLNP